VIVGVAIYLAVTGKSFSRSDWVMVFMFAIIGAQFWHGLMQFERIQPRMRIGHPQEQFWGLEEKRGSTGMGYYFLVTNLSVSESLQSVSAHLIAIDPNEVKSVLPLPLHIRHKDWRTVATDISPGASEGFAIATGPGRDTTPQRLVIPEFATLIWPTSRI
jgi:hypothetical protein